MKKKFLRQVDLTLLTFVSGITPMIAFALASRNLSGEDFTSFVSVWSILNVIILGFFSPIEAKSRTDFLALGQKRDRYLGYLGKMSLQAFVLAAALAFCFLAIFQRAMLDILGILSTLVFLIGSAASSFVRIIYFAEAQTRKILKVSITSSLLYISFLQIAVWFEINSYISYLVALPIAWLISVAYPLVKFINEVDKKPNSIHLEIDKEAIHLNLSYFLSLAPVAAPFVLLPYLGLTHASQLLVVGSVSLVRAGLTLVNTSTPWAIFSYSEIHFSRAAYRKVFLTHISLFFISIPIAMFLLTASNAEILRIYTSSQFQLDTVVLLLLVCSEVLVASSVTTRTLLFATNSTRSLILSWVVGLAVFLLVITFFGLNIRSLFSGLIACGTFVLLAQGFYAIKSIRLRQAH